MGQKHRVRWMGLLLVGVVAGSGFLGAQNPPQNPYTGNAEAAKEGYQIFQKMGCPGCHGAGGGGGMGWSLIDCIWRFGWDDATLFRLIKGQIPEQTMPRGFGDVLTDDQVWKIIAWVRTVNHCEENVIGTPTAATTAPNPEAEAQEREKACRLVAINQNMIRQTLEGFPDYASTYVILYRDDVTKPIQSLEDPALSKLRVGVNADTPVVELLKKAGASNVTTYSLSEGSPGQIVTDVLDRKVDVAVVWAPLASFFIWQLDTEHRLTAVPLAAVLTAPAPFQASGEAQALAYVQRCQQFLHGVLESYGVVPAQLLTAGSNSR